MRIRGGLAVLGGLVFASACATGESASGAGGKSGSGGTGNSGGTGGSATGGGTGGSVSGGGTGAQPSGGGAGGSTGGAAGGGGVAGSGAGGSGGAAGSGGGSGGTGPSWPTCDAQPSGTPSKTITQLWADNPSTETEAWVPGVYVTAISGSACVANTTCQVFLQQDENYASLAAGAKHGIKVRIAASVASHFTSLQVGDKVDVLGYAWRYNLGGANELVLQVNAQLPGCAKKIGTGNPTPITGVQLGDLSVSGYETTQGPLLIQLSTVTGKPALPTEIFGLWKTGVGIGDAGPESLVNASPFFLPNGAWVGLPTSGTVNQDFSTVTGVFAVFVPFTEAGTPPKYMVVYPRTMSEMAP
jgi:hypothetical protein